MVLDHKETFLKSFAALTGIETEKINEQSLIKNNPLNLINHPYSQALDDKVVDKINFLKEFCASYEVLKLIEATNKIHLNSNEAAGAYFTSLLRDVKDKERVLVAFLDSGNVVIETVMVFEGTVDQASIYPREIAKQALFYDCVSIIVAHNHPGERCQASQQDITLTQKLVDVLVPLNIRVLDHIIVAGEKYMSLLDQGMMPSRSQTVER